MRKGDGTKVDVIPVGNASYDCFSSLLNHLYLFGQAHAIATILRNSDTRYRLARLVSFYFPHEGLASFAEELRVIRFITRKEKQNCTIAIESALGNSEKGNGVIEGGRKAGHEENCEYVQVVA